MNSLPLEFIVLAPLAGALAIGLGGRFGASRSLVHGVAVGSVALSAVVAIWNFVLLFGQAHVDGGLQQLTANLWTWFEVNVNGRDVPVEVSFVFDHLSGLMTVMVTTIATAIHLFATGYMAEEKSYSRFFAYLNLFTASMLVLILGSSLPMMFVGWEGVGLCSYLLIGFWFENPSYAAAGRKAFVANRIGDFGVLIGMFILLQATGSFEFAEINEQAPFLANEFFLGGQLGFSINGASIATVACLFLFLGCTGKSAQLPLYVWLPDAMAGPTPVSALIHAATMVTSGIYLACRLSPVFLQSPTALSVIAIVGTVTAFIAATIAVVQKEMKKILAYSTVSQLGFMFAAVGVGAFTAGFFHVFTHAFFKACLFLGAGSVMHAVHAHGDANIFKLGGIKKFMPITHATFFVSCLAIAGIPPFAGFFSKDEILLGASTIAFHDTAIPSWVGWFVMIGLFVAALMTAFYMFRLFYMTFTGTYRSADEAHGADGHEDGEHDEDHDHDHGYAAHPHDNTAVMNGALVFLGLGALLAGVLGLPHHFAHDYAWWGHWMETSVAFLPGFGPADHAEDLTFVYVPMGLGLVAGFGGWLFARAVYKDKQEDTVTPKIPTKVFNFLFDKWRVDEFYGWLIIRPMKWLAQFSGWVDKSFVDGVIIKGTSTAVNIAGKLFPKIQTGNIQSYGLGIMVGVVVLTWWFVLPHPHFQATATVNQASVQAERGLGYTYRWDLNSDNEYDFPTQPSRITIDLGEGNINHVAATVQRTIGGDWPQNRAALGRLIDREANIYELTPPIDKLETLVQNLEALQLRGQENPELAAIESFEVTTISNQPVFAPTATDAQFTYDADDYVGALVRFRNIRGDREVRVDEHHEIVEFPEGEMAASFRFADGHLEVRPNGNRATTMGAEQPEPFVVDPYGTFTIGTFQATVIPMVRVTLQVQNAFGTKATTTEVIPLNGSDAPALAEVTR